MATTLSVNLSEREGVKEGGKRERERQIRRERKKCLLQAVVVGCIPAELWP